MGVSDAERSSGSLQSFAGYLSMNTLLRLSLLVGSFVFVASCAPIRSNSRQDISHLVRVSDNQALKRFDVELENTSAEAWCIEEGSWPNSVGYLDSHGRDVWVEANGRNFPITERNLGFCTSLCDFRMAPGEVIRGNIPYAEFSLPASVEALEKKLVMSIWSKSCH
ncbi:hypothetical protein QFZ41_002738 [Luteibacter sp. W1I16]